MNRYKLVVARKYCCVPAVLETICSSEGYVISQIDIANYFGINIPSSDIDCCHDIENTKVVDDERLWGVQLSNSSVNDFFNKHNILLSEHYIPISQIAEEFFQDIVSNQLNSGSHIVCGLNYEALFGNNNGEYGHVVLIHKAIDNLFYEILDPGPQNAGYRKVKSDDLFYSIKKKMDGLWCIKK